MNQIVPIASFPIFITEKLQLAKAFYTENFGFDVAFENDWYVHLFTQSGVQIGFLMPDHLSQSEYFHEAFSGNGAIFTLEVENVDTAHLAAKVRGLKMLSPVKAEEWGQKHFVIEDPSGVKIDVVQSTEPTDEYKQDYR